MEQQQQPELAPWLRVAHRYDGLRELDEAGELSPTVRAFFKNTSYPYGLVTKKTPWCAAFVCTVLQTVGVAHPRTARARDFLSSVHFLHIREPVIGALLVFDRKIAGGAAQTLHGHIGFCDRALLSSSQRDVMCFGGNQDNACCARRQPLDHLIGVLWPRGHDVHPSAVLL
jgi:uncharacterized protein (TIGR02594 family)